MSITASTSSTDRVVRKGPGRRLFESGRSVSTGQSYYQGDLMCYDSSLNSSKGGIRVVAATGDGATFIGISDVEVKSGVLKGPYTGLTATDAAEVGPDFGGPVYGVEADLVLKTSDAFVMGGKVYLVDGGDSQTVTSTDPGDHNYVGIFVDPNGSVTSASSGQLGRILVGCRYPAATGGALFF